MSNLLEKASILLTPTGYDNGSMNCIKPNTSVGDFDFTRGTAATRVNSQGLIEDVTDTRLTKNRLYRWNWEFVVRTAVN